MIILDSTTKSLQVVLAGAKATNDCPFTASYVDITTTTFGPLENDGTTNGTSVVTLVAAPSASTQRQLKALSIYNADTAPVTVKIQYNNNSTLRNIIVVTLAVGDNLQYIDTDGFMIVDTNGSIKESTGVNSVTNTDGTLTISPTTGSVIASLALGHANTWTAVQTFSNNNSATGTNTIIGGKYVKFGLTAPNNSVAAASATSAVELWDSDNTNVGVQIGVGNSSSGHNAFTGFYLNNDLASDGLVDHYGFIGLNSSTYNNVSFGTGTSLANQMFFENTDGAITFAAQSNSQFANFLVGGFATTNEIARFNSTGMTIGLAGTLGGLIRFAGATSTFVSIQAPAVGNSSVLTLLPHTSNIATSASTTETTNTATVVAIAGLTHTHTITALASADTFGIPTIASGTLDNTYHLIIRIKDNGTARALSWNSIFRAGSFIALPTTTTINKTLYVGFIYNFTDTKWDLVAYDDGF